MDDKIRFALIGCSGGFALGMAAAFFLVFFAFP